jgi:hypothetical protein
MKGTYRLEKNIDKIYKEFHENREIKSSSGAIIKKIIQGYQL